MIRHRLRTEFGLSAKEADEEPYDEAMMHLQIWSLQNKRQEKQARDQERKSRMRGNL